MTTLHDRLAGLADDIGIASPPPPDLWAAGKRRARRQRVRAAVGWVAAVLVLAAGAGAVTTVVQSREVPPAAPQGEPALPDQVYPGSSWLPHGFGDGAGAPLAAVYEDARTRWRGSEWDLLAVSAGDRSYRWLDLPGFEDRPSVYAGASWSLAPDGRHLAYWTRIPDGVRLNVVDTVDGTRTRHDMDGVGAASTLAWTGDSVWACPGQQCRGHAVRVDLATGRATEVANDGVAFNATYVPGGDGTTTATVQQGGGPVRVYRFDAGGAGAEAPLTEVSGSVDDVAAAIDSVAVSPDGSTLVATRLGRLRVGTVVPGGTTATTDLEAGSDLGSLAGWADATHVVARTTESLVEIDVTTGARRLLVRLPEATSPDVASDLFSVPTVRGEAPPTPIDPRVVPAVVAMGAVVLLGLWLVVRRRRARP